MTLIEPLFVFSAASAELITTECTSCLYCITLLKVVDHCGCPLKDFVHMFHCAALLHYPSFSIPSSDYPSALSDHHSHSSIPISPSPRILTGCPIPTVPPAGQSVPHVQTPLSDPSQPQPPLQVAKECPQSAKPPSGSRSGARGTGSISSAVCPLNRDKKQKLSSASVRERPVAKQPKNSRQKTTNGWRPVGLPFQKEVFSVVCRKSHAGAFHFSHDGAIITFGVIYLDLSLG